MKKLFLALVICFLSSAASAQGCGPTNPNCIVPTAPPGTSNNQAASTKFVTTNQTSINTILTTPTLINPIFQGASGSTGSAPIVYPSSGNFTCPGLWTGGANNIPHVVMWADQNQCTGGSYNSQFDSDPSSVLNITLSGAPNTGDIINLVFYVGVNTYTTQYTTKAADTAAIIATCLADSTIAGCGGTGACVGLNNPVGCSIGIKQIAALFTPPIGGLPGQILYNGSVGVLGQGLFGNPIFLDWNSAVSMYTKFTSTGSRVTAAFTGTNGSAGCGSTGTTPCKTGYDSGPTFSTQRCAPLGAYVLGVWIPANPPCVVPDIGSNIYNRLFYAPSSAGDTATLYAEVGVTVGRSTVGNILGLYTITASNSAGIDSLSVGNGVFTPGCAGGGAGLNTMCTGQFVAGGSGTAGSIAIGNNTSGTVTLQPPPGVALGSSHVIVPAVDPPRYNIGYGVVNGYGGAKSLSNTQSQVAIANGLVLFYTPFFGVNTGLCGLNDHDINIAITGTVPAGLTPGFTYKNQSNPTGVVISVTTTLGETAPQITAALIAAANANVTLQAMNTVACPDGIIFESPSMIPFNANPSVNVDFGFDPPWPNGLAETFQGCTGTETTCVNTTGTTWVGTFGTGGNTVIVTAHEGGPQYSNVGGGSSIDQWLYSVTGRSAVIGDVVHQHEYLGQDVSSAVVVAFTETTYAQTIATGNYSTKIVFANGGQGCGWQWWGDLNSSDILTFQPSQLCEWDINGAAGKVLRLAGVGGNLLVGAVGGNDGAIQFIGSTSGSFTLQALPLGAPAISGLPTTTGGGIDYVCFNSSTNTLSHSSTICR